MSLTAALSHNHRHALDYYGDKNNGRLGRAFFARASFLDATLVSVADLPSRIITFAYEFFRSLTVGALFLREAPRARLLEASGEVLTNVAQIVFGAVGVICPFLIKKTRNWIDSSRSAVTV